MDIKLKVNESTVDAVLALPPEGQGPGVLVLHAWWGLNPFFKEVCNNLAEQGFVTLAPDLNNGQVAKTVDEAKVLMEKRDDQSTGDIVMAAKDFLLAHPACKNEKLGVVGFSMGGAWSIILAAYAPEQVAATVLFYGNGRGRFLQDQIQGDGALQRRGRVGTSGRGTATGESPAGCRRGNDLSLLSGKTALVRGNSTAPNTIRLPLTLAWKRTFDFLKANLTG